MEKCNHCENIFHVNPCKTCMSFFMIDIMSIYTCRLFWHHVFQIDMHVFSKNWGILTWCQFLFYEMFFDMSVIYYMSFMDWHAICMDWHDKITLIDMFFMSKNMSKTCQNMSQKMLIWHELLTCKKHVTIELSHVFQTLTYVNLKKLTCMSIYSIHVKKHVKRHVNFLN